MHSKCLGTREIIVRDRKLERNFRKSDNDDYVSY